LARLAFYKHYRLFCSSNKLASPVCGCELSLTQVAVRQDLPLVSAGWQFLGPFQMRMKRMSNFLQHGI